MFRKLSGWSSPQLPPRKPKEPPLPSSNSTSKSKSQALIICSAALPDTTAAKSTPPHARSIYIRQAAPDGYHHHPQAELLPPETVITILEGFAKVLLNDRERFELLKSKCLEGAKLGLDDNLSASQTGSILKSSHTVLTYLSWGIRHIEKATASLHEADKENKEEHLKKAEQMLRSLTDSMQLELDDHPTAVLGSVRVPNAGFILGLAHVFLALVWKMRKNSSKFVASHLLEAFVVSPQNARQSFIPELWSQLFRPHLSAVEAWYKREHVNIVNSFPRPSSISTDSRPCSPSSVSPMPANAVVARANSLMDLVAGMRLSKRSASSISNESNIVKNEHDQCKFSERINMQVKLLSNLYEESLNEGTIQYARHYQGLIENYYGRFSFDQTSKAQTALPRNDDDAQTQPNVPRLHINLEEATTNVEETAVSIQVEYDAVESKVMSDGGWMGANALQLRRSLYDTIFGTVSMEKTSKKGRGSTASPSSHVSSLLHLCNKQLPQVLDPLRPKVEMNSQYTRVASDEPTAGHPNTANKPSTIRDVVNTEPSPETQEVDTMASSTTALMHSQSAEILVSDDPSTPNQESSRSIKGAESTEVSPTYHLSNHPQLMPKRSTAVESVGNAKRLIDFIQDQNHQVDNRFSSTPSHKTNEIRDQLSNTGQAKKSRSTTLKTEGTKVKEQRIMKRSNSESSAPPKSRDHGSLEVADQGPKMKINSKVSLSRRGHGSRPEPGCNTGKRSVVNKKKDEEATDVQVKYCTSFQVQRTRSPCTNNQFKESSIIETVSPNISLVDKSAGQVMCNQLGELANELRAVVRATRLSGSVTKDVGRCEELLLKLSQAWLECKSATLLQLKEGSSEDAKLQGSTGDGISALDGLTEELLFILANSELQEAQRLALCLLSATIGAKPNLDKPPLLPQHDHIAGRRDGCNKSAGGQLPSDPNVLQALSHLLQQRGRLPEAALLLHLLHPAQYSASCHQFLPHLLPLLLDLAQRNGATTPTEQHNKFDHYINSYNSPLHLFGDSLKPRTLALMMMSRLLATVDKVTRLQACKHVLFPNVNALPCLLHSLDCALSLDERAAAAFILTTCMQVDDKCRQHIVNHVKLNSVVALLQQSASSTSAFETAINFVTELLRTRKANITEMLGCIRQDGLLNCMHALMAYLQTASLENQPPAAGLLLQLDLLLGDDQRYSIFREEALEALLAPLLSENNKEASFNAAHVLSTIGRSHSEQELEAWLLKKAGLGATSHESFEYTISHGYISSTEDPMAPTSKDREHKEEEEEEEESAVVVEWDERVARALIRQGGGGLVSGALAKGLRSSIAEVRKPCLLVVAWLTSHLTNMRQNHHRRYKVCSFMSVEAKAIAKERMREALQTQLQEIAAVGSGCAIVERVCAALALQNLAK